MLKKILITLIILAVLPVLSSCLDDAVKPIKEAPPATWPEMTREDDPVQAMIRCYENPSLEDVMTTYESILHSEYFFCLAPEDVDDGEPAIFTRTEDISITAAMFRDQTQLELFIELTGKWYDLEEVDGGACPGCRVTTCPYYIRAQFGEGTDVYVSSFEGAEVSIIVAPDESDPAKWVIRAIYDH